MLADHFIRNIRIGEIRLGPFTVFSSDGIVADITCGIRWQLPDGTYFNEERNVTMVQEEGTWRLDGIIIPPSELSGTQPELPSAYLFQKMASV